MVNSSNEEEFATYEEQFWTLLQMQAAEDADPKILVIGPGNVHLDGH